MHTHGNLGGGEPGTGGVDKYKGVALPVLDHGHVMLVDYMGSDTRIEEVARLSYNTGGLAPSASGTGVGGEKGRTVNDTRGLLRYLLRHGHCYDEVTEVLVFDTRTGVVQFMPWPEVMATWEQDPDALHMGAYTPDTDTLAFERPAEVMAYDYEGEVYTVEHAQVSLRVTPEHRMFVGRRTKGAWAFGVHTAKEVAGRSMTRYRKVASDLAPEVVRPEAVPPWLTGNSRENLYTWGQFIGFFIGDGYAGGTDKNCVSFHLKKPRKKAYLHGLVTTLGLLLKEGSAMRVTLPSLLGAGSVRDTFRENFYTASGDKTLPPWVMLAPRAFREGVLDGLKNSDGSVKRAAWAYTTSSEVLARSIQVLGCLTSQPFSLPTRRVNGVCSLMAMSRSVEPTINQGRKQDRWEPYTGKTYCATVSTGVLMVRREGKTVLCGNSSPFEQVAVTLDMKLPIFVARQLVRHRTQKLNEVSARYSVLPEEFYVPSLTQVCVQSGTNKQGRGDALDPEVGTIVRDSIKQHSENGFRLYHDLLERGVARETARMVLSVNTYTHWCTTWDAHNLLHMLRLRLDTHAQWEVREYARVISEIVQAWLPLTWEAFTDYTLRSVKLSRHEWEVLVRNLDRDRVAQELGASGHKLSLREKRELLALLSVSGASV
jgi:thymidylate synthase (FAD)